MAAAYAGLDLLATAVVVLDGSYTVRYANQAAEDLLGTGARSLIGQPFPALFTGAAALETMLAEALAVHWNYRAQTVNYERAGREPTPLSCAVTPIDVPLTPLLVELRPIQEQLRLEREERLLDLQEATRELLRNLAHEIKNPRRLRGSGSCSNASLNAPT
jgi:two-component system nitrogen regulation sensor histidine kinase GlnL